MSAPMSRPIFGLTLQSKYKRNFVPSSHIFLYAVTPNGTDLLYKKRYAEGECPGYIIDRALEKRRKSSLKLHPTMSSAVRIRNLVGY